MTAGLVPVPESATVCGLPVALSLMLNAADSGPEVLGVKVTVVVAVAPAATVRGNVAGATAKSAALPPVTDQFAITRSAVPGLEMVIVRGGLALPFSWLPKFAGFGVTLIAGATPLPVKATV